LNKQLIKLHGQHRINMKTQQEPQGERPDSAQAAPLGAEPAKVALQTCDESAEIRAELWHRQEALHLLTWRNGGLNE